MKKIINKILIIFLIIIILFEFLCSSNISYAIEIKAEFINSLTSLMGGIVAYGIWLKRLILIGISAVFNEVMSLGYAASCGITEGWKDYEAVGFIGFATPYTIFFGKYKLFDVNFFDINDELTIINKIRIQVAEWFYIMRNIASVVLLCVLIYVGIRMALSTIAEEKAKYKKMFVDWVCSLALIFVLQYIAIFTIYANNAIVNALKDMFKTTSDLDTAIIQIATQAAMPVGLGSIVATFVFAMIVFQTISFMISYTQRMLKVGFLLIISPLISLTYSIDKIGDGKAQALNAWLKEFVYTILIQPFHCIIYIAFVNSAIVLLSKSTILESLKSIFTGEFNQLANGILVILCLKFINDGETAIRKIFNFQDDGNLTSLAAGMVVGMSVMKNAQKIGGKTMKGINSAKQVAGKFGIAMKADSKLLQKFDNLKNTATAFGLGRLIGGASEGGNGNSNASDRADTSAPPPSDNEKEVARKKAGTAKKMSEERRKRKEKREAFYQKHRVLNRARTWAARQLPTKQNFKNALPGALGMMGMAMSYATGSSGVIEAIALGNALEKGADELFSSTLGTVSDELKESDDIAGEASLEAEEARRDEEIRQALINKRRAEAEKRHQEFDPNSVTMADVRKEYEDYIRSRAILDNPNSRGKAREKAKKHIEGLGPEKIWKDKQGQEHVRREESELHRALRKKQELGTQEGRDNYKFNNAADTFRFGGASDKEILQKGEQLLQAIYALKQKQKVHDMEDDNTQVTNFTDAETDSVDKTFDSIRQSIDRSVVLGSGGSLDMSRLIQQQMGLDDDGSNEYQSIMRAALEYREMVASRQSEGIYGKWGQLNGTREQLFDAAY